jgi:phospholipase C
MESPERERMAIVVLYDDSDGWYDHQMGPIVRQSNTPDDALFAAGTAAHRPPASSMAAAATVRGSR